ncbi:MAG: replicative DNA helicase [Clostridium sp.]|uniref:replicative DNA helicase n=1 Tax=Clostridium sp. TaxID=1506 RepID=UPI00306A80CE
MELPKTLQGEQAILGGMICYPRIIDEVIELIKPEELYYESHKKIYREICRIYEDGITVDIPTIAEALNNTGKLMETGGITYLTKLYESSTAADNIKYHCANIRDRAIKRKLIMMCNEILKNSQDNSILGADIISKMGDELYKIVEDRGRMFTLEECLNSSIDGIEKRYINKGTVVGATTGMKSLDKVTGGLKKGNFNIIAGRPSMGKTALGLNIASKAAIENRVAIFSFEMSKEELADRLLSDDGDIPMQKIKSGKLNDEEFETLMNAAARLSSRYAFIYDGGALTVGEIRARVMKEKLKGGLDVVVIDYLQLIKGDKDANGSRYNEVTKISRELKNLARELDICVVALAQLNRASEGRGDKRPTISDLRDSGSIEQDADIVMLLHRQDYYDYDCKEKGVCDVIVGKNRNGITGTLKLKWKPEVQRFYE